MRPPLPIMPRPPRRRRQSDRALQLDGLAKYMDFCGMHRVAHGLRDLSKLSDRDGSTDAEFDRAAQALASQIMAPREHDIAIELISMTDREVRA